MMLAGPELTQIVIFVVLVAAYFLALEAIVLGYAHRASRRKRLADRLSGARNDKPAAFSLHAEKELARTARNPHLGPFDRALAQAGTNPRVLSLFAAASGVSTLVLLSIMGLPLLACYMLAAAAAVAAPLLVLKVRRGRRIKAFEAQLPDAIETIVRSLRAGHPLTSALRLLRDLPEPTASAFGTVADEVTYGLDLETAMRNLSDRVGQQDLPLLVTAVAIQSKSGGNLGEVLQGLAQVIRERLRMRMKIKAVSAEARISAWILSVLPFALFGALQIIAPGFYGAILGESLVQAVLAFAVLWLIIGNIIMFRMVRFEI